MSRQIEAGSKLSKADKEYLAQRENIIGVPNMHGWSAGEAPWEEPPVNPGDVNGAELTYSTDRNTVGDEPHPDLYTEQGGPLPVVERVEMPDVEHPEQITAMEAEAARQAASASVTPSSQTANYEDQNMGELRDACEKAGLAKSGTKPELIARLRAYDADGQAAQTDQDGDDADE